MKKITDIKLEKRICHTDYSPSYSEIIAPQTNTLITIPGSVLESCFDRGDGTALLFVTDDVLFEESLYIFHVDMLKNMILDRITMFSPYSTGILNINTIDNSSICFKFISDTQWKVLITEKPVFFTGRFYREIKRPLQLKSRLIIKKCMV